MACLPCFKDYISCGNETIAVVGNLTPATLYTWVLTNKGAKYSGEVTTDDEDGTFIINTSLLPDGLLNPYAGTFELQVFLGEGAGAICNPGTWNDSAYCDPYDCIIFEVVNGTEVKNTLGCPCDLL